MSIENFERSVAFVLKHEGTYVNDIRDRGGETNFGISKRAYPNLDIKNLTVEQAKEIYKRDYWDKTGCDALDWPMCLIVFDTAVNMGVGRAQAIQAEALNWSDYLFMRLDRYVDLNQPAFLKGFLNRVLDLWRMAKEGEHPTSEYASDPAQDGREDKRGGVKEDLKWK